MRLSRLAAITGALALGAAVLVASDVSARTTTSPVGGAATTAAIPQYDHVVVVIFENTNYTSIKGGSSAPYFNSLAGQGSLMTRSFGVTHPSQPNYLALFSGSQQGITDDSCPHDFTAGNLGQQLIDKGLSFTAYSEDLPGAGSTSCSGSGGNYVRKHAPWADFPTVRDASHHVPFSQFPSDYSQLPTVSFVVPNMCNDIHDCSIGTGDTWLKNHLDAYAQWAKTHNSLLIQTFDEDNFTSVNQIYTTFVGQGVKPGYESTTQINHYSVLRTLEDMYGLPALGNAANKTPITDIFGSSPSPTPTATASPTPPACSGTGQKLGNAGFESGTTGWTASSGVIGQWGSSGEPAHSGTWDAWLDGYGSSHTDSLSQSVTIPAGCGDYTLSFWLHVDTAETTSGTAYDKLTVSLGSTTLATYSNLDKASGYVERSFDVKGFAGQTVTLKFTGAEDSSLQTSFVVDDTAVTVS